MQLEGYVSEGRTAVESMMTIDTGDRIHIVMTTVDRSAVGEDSHWGHPSSEVLYLCSSDGGKTFESSEVSPPDLNTANWLPSISRSGPHHPVDNPTILYTHGDVGSGLSPDTKTEVWCLQIDEA